jgi:hypothetical protein
MAWPPPTQVNKYTKYKLAYVCVCVYVYIYIYIYIYIYRKEFEPTVRAVLERQKTVNG